MSEAELASLKSTLRSLVVSSPTRVDLRSLLRDYRSLIGEQLPLNRFGYRDPLTFLQERCSDCFLFQGIPSNPSLTLIVPETLKHIDKFVQNQKATPSTKLKGKRTSIPENVSHKLRSDLIVKSYNKKNAENKVDCRATNTRIETERDLNSNIIKPAFERDGGTRSGPVRSDTESGGWSGRAGRTPARRAPAEREACAPADPDNDGASSAHTSSSQSSTKKAQLEELKDELHALIKDSKDGIWCKELVTRYRERYGRLPDFTRFGYTTIVGLVQAMSARVRVVRVAPGGDWLLQDAAAPLAPAPAPARPAPAPAPAALWRPAPASRAARDEDALPGVPYAPDVFPADCLRFEESVPPADLSALRPGLNLEAIVGEVYSPSHFWLIRLGPEHNIAMENLMDEMTAYFESGEGRARFLAPAALRVGQYCAALYDRDWHRAIIVDLLDGDDIVKVRHVDYGTVDAVAAATLRPLPRRWARLPMQAVRARQAGVRPAAAGRRWPHAAAEYFLRLVRDRPLIASVVALDGEEATLEVFLVDTSQDEDEDLAAQLVRAGYADRRPDSALRANDCYLYPVFSALESGATPNFAEIQRYLQDGITLDYVPAYRRHVPAALPPLAPAPAPTSPPPPPALTRVPLLRPVSPLAPPVPATRSSEPALPTSPPTSAPAPTPAPTPAPVSAPAPTAAPAPHRLQNAYSCNFQAPRVPCPPAMPPPPFSQPPPPPLPLPLPAPPLGVMPPPFGALPPFGTPLPPYGAGAGAGEGGELWRSAADWAMYQQLSATAHWYKMAAMRRAHLAAAAAAAPPFPPPPRFAPGPPPGF